MDKIYPQVKIDSPKDRNPRLPIAERTPPICRPHYGNEFGFDARRGYKYMRTWDRAARVLAYFKHAITRPIRRQGCLCRYYPFSHTAWAQTVLRAPPLHTLHYSSFFGTLIHASLLPALREEIP